MSLLSFDSVHMDHPIEESERHAGSCAYMGERVGSRYADLMSSFLQLQKVCWGTSPT